MRTTVTIDEILLEQAQSLCLHQGNNEIIREGLRALIQRESAKRLALLGGGLRQQLPHVAKALN